MVDMKELRRLADASGVRILEDSAHCVEGLRDGVRPGQLSDAAAFSFYATKSLTSGEGGAAVTNDEALAEWLRIIRLHGMSKSATARYQHYEHWDMAEPGYKENMFELQAALLLPQLAKLERLWEKREAIAQRYEAAFAAAGIEFPQTLPSVKNARHLYTIWTPDGRRDDILAFLQRQGIGVAVNYRAVHLREYYQRALGFREGDFPTAEAIGRRTISLPLYPRLETEEIDYVIDKVIEAHRVAR
jgi:UDP-4-amino-4-deoxy-L-arabinose-oxoglutarate aminotransferase